MGKQYSDAGRRERLNITHVGIPERYNRPIGRRATCRVTSRIGHRAQPPILADTPPPPCSYFRPSDHKPLTSSIIPIAGVAFPPKQEAVKKGVKEMVKGAVKEGAIFDNYFRSVKVHIFFSDTERIRSDDYFLNPNNIGIVGYLGYLRSYWSSVTLDKLFLAVYASLQIYSIWVLLRLLLFSA